MPKTKTLVSTYPAVGSLAPDFVLPDQNGQPHKLSSYRGRSVLLYFYPKDDTPGCTTEACTLRDSYANFAKSKTVILGVSVDPVKSHIKFAKKYELPFPILSDEEKEIVKLYGVWNKKKFTPLEANSKSKNGNSSASSPKNKLLTGFMGREYLGTNRVSFLIDSKGKIAKVYESVKPALHAQEVLSDLKKSK